MTELKKIYIMMPGKLQQLRERREVNKRELREMPGRNEKEGGKKEASQQAKVMARPLATA